MRIVTQSYAHPERVVRLMEPASEEAKIGLQLSPNSLMILMEGVSPTRRVARVYTVHLSYDEVGELVEFARRRGIIAR